MHKFKLIIVVFILSFITNSCVPVAVVGSGAAVGSAAVQERSIGSQIDDTTIWTKIKAKLTAKQKGYSSLSITVRQGRVLVTGEVDTAEDKVEVVKAIWSCKGVAEVDDEMVLKNESNGSVKTFASDSWITTQVKSEFLVEKTISSVNYTVETVDGVVYLFGTARNQEELRRATEIAATVKNVKKVVSYVKVVSHGK